MQYTVGSILAYGVEEDAGSFECIDCGHRYRHPTRAPLPPCPRYRDSTHGRAAWRPAEPIQSEAGRDEHPGA